MLPSDGLLNGDEGEGEGAESGSEELEPLAWERSRALLNNSTNLKHTKHIHAHTCTHTHKQANNNNNKTNKHKKKKKKNESQKKRFKY